MEIQTKKVINKCLIEIKNRNNKYVDILYYLVAHRLKYIAMRYLKNEEDVKDLEQDFWADIYKNADKFSYVDNGYSYLNKIMTNMAINRYNKLHGEMLRTIEYATDNSNIAIDESMSVERMHDKVTVERAIDELEPLESLIIQLFVYEDKTIVQIATDLKLSKSKVGRIKLSAEKKLKKKLSKSWEKSER